MAFLKCAKEKSRCIFLTIFFISFTLSECFSRYSYSDDENSSYEGPSIDFVPFGKDGTESIYLTKRDTNGSSIHKKATSTNFEKKIKMKTAEGTTTTLSPVSNKTAKTPTETPTVTWLPDLPATSPSPINFNGTKEDSHDYYNSTFYNNPEVAMSFWVNLTYVNATENPLLSNSYRRAATVHLSFDFPFHGHVIRNITVATGGFLYTGNIMHTWLAATQYIAPMMANIDTSVHNDSTVKYYDNGTSFTVEWDEVYLQDANKDGPFSFQVTLKDNGDIVFVYKKVQVPVTQINEESHPVKVGLSDAYIIDKMIFFIRRKTIYEYHRIDKKTVDIGNKTAIYFTALPTCLDFKTCKTCQEANISFDCSWCSAVQRCSSGLDRKRQEWMVNHCEENKNEDCSATTTPKPTTTTAKPVPVIVPISTASTEPSQNVTIPVSSTTTTILHTTNTKPTPTSTKSTPTTTAQVQLDVRTLPPSSGRAPIKGNTAARVSEEEKKVATVGAGAVIAILLIVALVAGFAVWVVYAYKFPQTPSGQLLIKYRPSQWRLRHGEARYTAASIHI